LQELGYELGDNALNDAFERFKALADRKKDVFDEDIMALVDDEVAHAHDRARFVGLEIAAGPGTAPRAVIELEIDGRKTSAAATGNGPVDAIFNAIRELMPHDANLALYQVSAVTGGTDAQAEVSVRLEERGRVVVGQGADPDTLIASARAYIHALNKLAIKRLRTAPPESQTVAL
jgi:2-isopropylmalate synthase